MTSSIKISLGENNEPILRFVIIPSEDIRDQLCQQFFQKLGGESNICKITVRDNDPSRPTSHTIIEISPLEPIRNINIATLVMPDKLYSVSYTIDNNGNKQYKDGLRLLGKDLTEKQIKELYFTGKL